MGDNMSTGLSVFGTSFDSSETSGPLRHYHFGVSTLSHKSVPNPVDVRRRVCTVPSATVDPRVYTRLHFRAVPILGVGPSHFHFHLGTSRLFHRPVPSPPEPPEIALDRFQPFPCGIRYRVSGFCPRTTTTPEERDL